MGAGGVLDWAGCGGDDGSAEPDGGASFWPQADRTATIAEIEASRVRRDEKDKKNTLFFLKFS
ncbi:hypothetical protein GCM10020370_64420 [Paenibacillus hodogayensis]